MTSRINEPEFADLDQEGQYTAKQNSFQKRLLRAITTTTGQCKMVVIPRLVLEFCQNDMCRATMLSHLIFLCDKGRRRDNFIYKSFREWTKETGLSQYEVTQASQWLRKSGLIQTEKIRVYGHPTIHYKLNQEQLIKNLAAILSNNLEDISPPLVNKVQLKFSQCMLKN